MTNIFKILWFEDTTAWYQMEQKKVERHLQDRYSLQLSSTRDTGANFDPIKLDTNNDFDLILMDYKLSAGKNGKQFIDMIRSNEIITDILLYSSEFDKMSADLKAENPLIDGVFFADRKNELFESKLFSIIHKIVRHSEDIVNLRGFFLDNTSDFEVRIKEILKLAWDKLPDERERLSQAMEHVLENIEKHDSLVLSEIRKDTPIYLSANNHKYALTIRNRIRVINEIVDILKESKGITISSQYIELENFEKYYSDEISTYRNALGHKKYSDTALIINGKPVKIDKELHQKLRKNVSKYDHLICFLENTITAL